MSREIVFVTVKTSDVLHQIAARCEIVASALKGEARRRHLTADERGRLRLLEHVCAQCRGRADELDSEVSS